MTTDAPSAAPVAPPRPKHYRAYVAVLTLAAVHAWAVWGYTGVFWGEHGRWLYSVTRFAAGDVPFRDFAIPNPPMSYWVVGGLARLAGTQLQAITAIMTAIYLALFVLFLSALRRVVPQHLLPIALPALLFAVSYASRHGVTLPAGTESPAEPVGFFFLLAAAWLMFENLERPDFLRATVTGVMLAFAVMTKHDFWVSAMYLVGAGAVVLYRRRAPTRVQLACPAAFALTLVVAIGFAAQESGLLTLLNVLAGSGRALEFAVATTPSLERIVAEIAACAALGLTGLMALWMCLAVSDQTAKRWAGILLLTFLTAAATHLGMSVAIGDAVVHSGPHGMLSPTEEAMWTEIQHGRGLVSAALVYFDTRLQAHLFPYLLPPILLAVVLLRWRHWEDPRRRARLVLLLGLCMAARLRYGLGGADWYNVLLDLPAYALFLELLCARTPQKAIYAVRAAAAMLLAIGIYSYVSLGVGHLTLRGTRPAMPTRAGIVHWSPAEASAYRLVDSLLTAADPSGRRPLYAFGASGGWNYFLDRANPLPWSAGLPFTPAELDSARARFLASDAFLVDNRYALRSVPGRSSVTDWEPAGELGRFALNDRAWFERVRDRCHRLGDGVETDMIQVFDCRQATQATR